MRKIIIIIFVASLAAGGAFVGFKAALRKAAETSPAHAQETQVSTEEKSSIARASADDTAVKAGFLPHRALYDIKLAGSKSGSQIINIGGQMFYEWQPSCEAWITNHRFKLRYEYADSPPMEIASEFSTYESFDKKSLSFTSQRKRDGDVFEELRGQADLDDENKGEARYSIPEGLSYSLPAGSMFPMGHTLAVLDAIKAGKKFFTTVIFDGSDEEGPVEINAFIGKKIPVSAVMGPVTPMSEILQSSPAWNVRLAFFPLSKPEATSDYEMSIIFHENGVISDMTIDYHDFSVSQKLVALDKMKGSCGVSGSSGGKVKDKN